MINELDSFPSNTQYNESEKKDFIKDDFSADDSENIGLDKFTNEPIYSLKDKNLKENSVKNNLQNCEVDDVLKEAFLNFNNEFLKRFTVLDSSLISLSNKFSENKKLQQIESIDSISVNDEDTNFGEDVIKLIDTTLNKFLEYSEEDNESLLFKIKDISRHYDENNTLVSLNGLLDLISSLNLEKEKTEKKSDELFNPRSLKLLMFLGGSFLLGGISYSLLDDILGKVSFEQIVDNLMEEGILIEYNGPLKGQPEDKKEVDPSTYNEGYDGVLNRPLAEDIYGVEEKAMRNTEDKPYQQTPSDTSALSFTKRTGDIEHYNNLNPQLKESVEAMARDYKQITKNNLLISSTFRSKEENTRVGGASKSRHLTGNAIDIKPSQVSELRRLGLLKKYGLEAPYRNHPEHVQMIGGKNNTVSRVEPPQPKQQEITTPPTDIKPFTHYSTDNKVDNVYFSAFQKAFPDTAHFLNEKFFGNRYRENKLIYGILYNTRNSILQIDEASQNLSNNSNITVNAAVIHRNQQRTHNPDKTE